ncbi:MAG: hypothetical protein GTO40_10865, partial [Deltaproteobacteria bacterium]|nr:hypothetical protein [Deltaproteobacteria bacterium]
HPLGKGLVSGPYVKYGFTQIFESDVLDVFPKLRVAFLEAGCDWTVSIVSGLQKKDRARELLGDRVFVGCLPKEDLAYVMNKLGDDFLITATDFPHGDAFREDRLAQDLKARGDLNDRTIEKILADNPARLYAFS